LLSQEEILGTNTVNGEDSEIEDMSTDNDSRKENVVGGYGVRRVSSEASAALPGQVCVMMSSDMMLETISK
jgi:hypothetical protein